MRPLRARSSRLPIGRYAYLAVIALGACGSADTAPAKSAAERSAPERSAPASAPTPATSPATAVPATDNADVRVARAPSSAAAATGETIAASGGDSDWKAINLRACGITLRVPPTYVVTHDRISKDPLRSVDVLEDGKHIRALIEGKGPPGEWPPQVNFTSYPVAKDADPVKWLLQRPGPQVTAKAIAHTRVAGLPALFYRSSGGEALVDGVVWSCPGRVVEASAPFHAPGDRLRREFARMLTMVQVEGALNAQPVGCTPPGLPCSSPQLSSCVDGRWACRSLDAVPGARH